MFALILTLSVMGQTPSWKEIDALVGEQKLEAASQAVEKRLAEARKAGDDTELARALVQLTQLRIGLGGYETAVKRLRDEAWPTALLPRTTVQLFYAASLDSYLQSYSWEIRKREKVDTSGALDLKKWTAEQISAEAQRTFEEIWKNREALGGQPISALDKSFLTPNTYPKGVRDTLRDAVTYLRVQHLANTQWWSPEASNSTWQLNLASLIAGDAKTSKQVNLADEQVHPLVRIGAILDDLEAWHLAAGRQEAALFARLERLEVLRTSFTAQDERTAIQRELEARITGAASLPFSAFARATLAMWIAEAGDLARARDVAAVGAKAFPQSVGGRRCAHLVASYEAPDFSLQVMTTDGPGRRSLMVQAKNLTKLHLRAWKMDLEQALGQAGYSPLPNADVMRGLLNRPPDVKWSVDLSATPDLAMHQTFLTPPMKGLGLYVIAGSARADFVDKENHLVGVTTIVTGLVITVKQVMPDASAQVIVRDGATGAPVSGAEVQLLGGSWNVPRKVIETQVSGADGLVTFKGGRPTDVNYLAVARKGADVTVDLDTLYFWNQPPRPVDTALIYTDRSIYRPNQKVQWKIVAYRGQPQDGKYQVVANAQVPVRLMDANYQEVAKLSVTTNGFGSASGSFTVPAGRLLGMWRIEARSAQTMIRVEEYKRPTFEVSFRDTAGAMKLNAPVTLTGDAKYYFGLPVTSGKVKWRATRTPVFPWWWWGGGATASQVVGSGVAALKDDGSFAVTFTPLADPKLAKDVSYSYSVEAEITDEGGETRSATRMIRLGQISVQASFGIDVGFFRLGQAVAVPIRRTDLNGVGRAGKGTWRLLALTQPSAAVLPADEPPARSPFQLKRAFQTPGDEVRPRWETSVDPAATMRAWKDGAEHSRGELTHDAAGDAKVIVPKLAPGAWRIRYETKDDFGATWEMATEFIVAEPKLSVMLPALALAEETRVPVGGVARFAVSSAFAGQPLLYEVFRGNKAIERRWIIAGKDSAVIERKITADDRGGFAVQISAVRDWQLMRFSHAVTVPWDDRELSLEFATFRDKLRPGAKETFRVTVKGQGHAVEAGAAEVLAYMYDQSLELFVRHAPPNALALYPNRTAAPAPRSSLGMQGNQWLSRTQWYVLPDFPSVADDELVLPSGYGIGGMGDRGRNRALVTGAMRREEKGEVEKKRLGLMEPAAAEEVAARSPAPAAVVDKALDGAPAATAPASTEGPAVPVRQNFSETAFFSPHLITDGAGSVSVEFTVPDSVTAWNVWAHALTRDLRGGSVKKETRTVKDLMVRPYVPRFLREGDQAVLKVLVNNASAKDLSGELLFDIIDPATEKSVLSEFGIASAAPKPFSAKAGQGATLTFMLTAPKRVGEVAVKVVAKAGDLSDGELRPVPLLPSRMHLAQSRFATLKDKSSRTLRFDDLAKSDDPTRINEQLVVTVDAQLFYSVLSALPYLTRYPYECTEQTMNRFLSTGIVSSVYRDNPAIAKMGKQLSKRETPLETFDSMDPNRKLELEEAPWLVEAKGGKDPRRDDELINMLDPKVIEAERASALAKLAKAQLPNGGFPWFPGGPPSPYITLYLLHGMSRALEFKVDVPRPMATRAWQYVGQIFHSEYAGCLGKKDCNLEFVTFINYVASAFPDASWLGGALSPDERKRMLEYSFTRWREHSPLLKGYLALTLERAGRHADAKLVFNSVMDSSKTTEDEGTFWQPEDRAWLWYNDTIESHAFALRVLMELEPKDARRAGLVQWLLLNKKLSHWKSTRATAEVIYSLVKFMSAEHQLGIREESNVTVGPVKRTFVFEPDQYTGKKNQLVIPGAELDPKTMSSVTVSKSTPGFQFASATWHFSTDKLPAEARGDFFNVTRAYFKRVKQGAQVTLQPLADGAKLEPGDELEVQLSIRAKQAAEYVHLRDPRGAGFEPEAAVSRYKYDLGLGWYEEYRDSGTNFFFDRVPPGEYTFKYRVRANMGGTFRVGPATLQSMYAPEFTAYSAGNLLGVATGGK